MRSLAHVFALTAAIVPAVCVSAFSSSENKTNKPSVSSASHFASTSNDNSNDDVQPLRARSTTYVLPRKVPATVQPPSKGGAIIQINEESVQFTAGLVGAIVGLSLDGVAAAAAAAAVANYLARKDGQIAGDVITAVSRKTIEIYNYFVQLESRYELLNKAGTSISQRIREIDPETHRKLEGMAEGISNKFQQIDDEYGIVGAASKSLGLVGDVVETTVDNSIAFGKENKLGDKLLEAEIKSLDEVKGQLPASKN